MNGPKRIIVEYGDGTRHEAPFSKLSSQARMELSALGLCEAPSDIEKNYLLLEWKDGWKEVLAVDGRAVELLRYYTVERVEEVGRLSVEMADAYPQLLMIKRLPGAVESILLVRKEGVQVYTPLEKATVKEGGKIEHVFYDKKRPNFAAEDVVMTSARYAAILDPLEKELQKRGVSASAARAKGASERAELYKELARAVGLRGAERQIDLYGFLDLALERMEPAENQTGKKGG